MPAATEVGREPDTGRDGEGSRALDVFLRNSGAGSPRAGAPFGGWQPKNGAGRPLGSKFTFEQRIKLANRRAGFA